MVTQHTTTRADQASELGIDSPSAVVFRGDGEPKSPESMVSRLADIIRDHGIDSDNYSIGGVVGELEARMAHILGKDDAVFMPTGTLANHLAIRLLCDGQPRAIVQEQSHVYHDTGDCVQQLSGIHLVPVAPGRTYFTLDDVRSVVQASAGGRVSTPVGALMIETPVRRKFGQIMPLDEVERVTEFCSDSGIKTHLDGARLFMMSAATGVAPAVYSAMFDTVYVSLYKYLGAPFGALLAGTSEFCENIYDHRRMFGGGLSNASLAAALALDGLEGFEDRFAAAMSKARSLFDDLNRISGVEVRAYANGSNIFPIGLPRQTDAPRLIERLSGMNIFVGTDEGDDSSMHLTVNTTILRQPNSVIAGAFETALNGT